jgi:hypothetical protein
MCAPAAADPAGPDVSWPLVGGGEPAPQSFPIRMGSPSDSTRDRGMVGGGGYFHATVHVAPRYEAPGNGKLYLALDDRRVWKDGVTNNEPGGLAVLGWEFALMDIGSPASRITQVRAYFDNGQIARSNSAGGVYELPIPDGARGLQRFEVDWAWRDNVRTLRFGAGLAPRHYEVLGLLAAVAGAALLRKKRWIAVRLMDDDKKPIPSARFRLRVPDGTLHDGRLDEYGFALVAYESPAASHPGVEEALDLIVRGVAARSAPCDVTFPDLESTECQSSGTSTLGATHLEEG